MKQLFLALLLSAFALGSATAQETCESKAVGKNGRPLAGAAKALRSFARLRKQCSLAVLRVASRNFSTVCM